MRSIPSSESSGAGSPVGEFKGRASSIDNCALKPVPKSADEAPTTVKIYKSVFAIALCLFIPRTGLHT
jgi:hypothetical protein